MSTITCGWCAEKIPAGSGTCPECNGDVQAGLAARFSRAAQPPEAAQAQPSGWQAFKVGLRGAQPSGERAPFGLSGSFAGYTLNGRTLSKGLNSWDITGAVAEFQHGANLGGRVTLTRVALTGVFALALKKDRNKVYIAVQLANGHQVLIEGRAKDEKAARSFAQKIEQASRHYAASDARTAVPPTPANSQQGSDPVEQITQLGQLRDAGLLTEDEFAAKTAEILRRM